MTISRANAASHLHSQFAKLAIEISQTATDDSANGYGPDIDQALLKLGVVYGDLAMGTAVDDDVGPFFALADYYALRRFASKLAVKIDAATQFTQTSQRLIFDNVMRLLAEAKEVVEAFGFTVGAASGWELLRLNLDFIEPDLTRQQTQ